MISCPNCSSQVNELVACEVCQTIGCIKCVTRFEKKWVCGKCKGGEVKIDESSLWGMFG